MDSKKKSKLSLGDGNIPSSADNKMEDRYCHEGSHSHSHGHGHSLKSNNKSHLNEPLLHPGNVRQNQVGTVVLFGVPIVSLVMEGKERLCLAQISSTLLKEFSYNEIHNRRVALGITCIQCTPVQLEILRRAGAMPVTSRRCGMITRREAERLCQSFLGDHAPPQLPENFAFNVYHECAWGCRGAFVPARYNSSRAKCIRCSFCQLFFSPNKFIFHSHRLPDSHYVQPDAANFNSWRRHLKLCGDSADEVGSTAPSYLTAAVMPSGAKDGACVVGIPPPSTTAKGSAAAMVTAQIVHAWEDVKAMFNGGTRKRLLAAQCTPTSSSAVSSAGILKSSTPKLIQSNGNGNGNSGHHAHPNAHAQAQSHNNGHGNSPSPQLNRQSHFLSHTNGGGGHIQNSNPLLQHRSTPPAYISPLLPVNVTAPILNPGIWNPGVSAPRMGNCGVIPTMPLSIHPLQLPWLRRPLFPFSHPFGPTCKFLGGNETGICGGESCGLNSSTSAFKPVGVAVNSHRSPTSVSASTAAAAEHLFSTWLNNSVNLGSVLPEDLSVNSSVGTPSPPSLTIESDLQRQNSKIVGNSNSPGKTTATAVDILESSDEENVDIESTIEGEKIHSHDDRRTKSTLKNRDEDHGDDGDEEVDIDMDDIEDVKSPDSDISDNDDDDAIHNHINGTTTMTKLLTSKRYSKKRLWDFDRGDD